MQVLSFFSFFSLLFFLVMMVTQRKEMAGWGVIFVLVALNGAQLE